MEGWLLPRYATPFSRRHPLSVIAHLSDIEPRRLEEARNWFGMRKEWGPELQAEKLRNMIDASERDLDYWEALHYIAIGCQDQRRRFPAMLADWDIEVRLGLRS